ncbi:hypothetical protein Prede_0032 [Prevotella dentalis DSM 3688]|uniref:Uncharacterized protein n=1 Tax=Prevotella dentalis (strain ATCC 49559 / DSM 3688 / JCM 13448 / NCTC 12043 / ES 2772) TaxID=908937 RepID=L0J861_PREDD|nr:hypothetical protein Prede_0032 [Prevotella dentalis DSM 3688]
MLFSSSFSLLMGIFAPVIFLDVSQNNKVF